MSFFSKEDYIRAAKLDKGCGTLLLLAIIGAISLTCCLIWLIHHFLISHLSIHWN